MQVLRCSPMQSSRVLLTAAFLTMVLVCGAGRGLALAQRLAGSLSVRVSDADTEEPIFQADVRLYTFGHGNFSLREFTDGTGRATFFSVERGSYNLEVRKDGYGTSRENVDISPGTNQTVLVLLAHHRDTQPAISRPSTVSSGALSIPPAARKEYEKGVRELKSQPERSLAHFQKAIEHHPKYAEAYAMLGLAQMRTKQNDGAMKSLTRAIELDPKLRLAHTALGQLWLEMRDFARGEKELQESYRLDSAAWDTNFQLARCYFNMDKLDQALEHARRAQAASDAPATTHLLLFDIYLRMKNPQMALEALDAFAEADPKSPLMPRVEEKRKKLRKGLAVNPAANP